MTWFTTWPANGIPQYEAHRTEAKAARHAEELVRSGRTKHATYFQTDTEEHS